MLNSKKKKKNLFLKLYRYYCAKLLSRIWVVLLYFLLWVILIVTHLFSSRKIFADLLAKATSWQMKLFTFWLISFIQLGALMSMMTPLVSYLVGRGLGWKEFKKKQLFRLPKISREEDMKVLIFTPGVDRETVIRAKFTATFTFFLAINFFLTLLGFFYFLFFTNFGAIAACSFLLLNGVGFGLVNFLIVAPLLFYQQEGGSFWVYLLCFVFIILLSGSLYLLRNLLWQYPIVFCLLLVPFYILAGYLFFSLYRKKFLKSDLD